MKRSIKRLPKRTQEELAVLQELILSNLTNVRMIIILLFTLVKTKNDILWYGITITLTSVGNSVFNFIRLRKYLCICNIDRRSINPYKHLKS